MAVDANVALFRFECANLDPETFKVVSFHGVEEVSRLYRFEFSLASTDPEIDFSKVINQPASFLMMRGDEPAPVRGIVIDFEQSGRSPDYYVYRAVVVPKLWLLTLFHQSRIFQKMSAPDIIKQVLSDAGLSVKYQIKGTHAVRDYCVQYRETDFNFISRLMEHEGICYYFDHAPESETLVITNNTGGHSPIEGESTMKYDDADSFLKEHEVVQDVIYREQVVTGKVVLKDYNYRTPSTDLMVESQINSNMPGVYYDYGDHYKDAGEGKALAKVRNEEIECQRRVLQGSSNCMGFRSGFTFAMQEFYRPDLNGDYLITRVEHQGTQREAMGLTGVADFNLDGEPGDYGNTFTAIPANVPFRPARLTPIPQLPGIMTAKLETAGGDYAYIDEGGEYRAKMPFDMSGEGNGQASRAIRMAQPNSGPGYGIHFPHHANTEVVWACVNGNLDRPLGLGTVPNPSNTSPSTSGNKAQNVIRTFGQHELTFDDTKGSENIYLHSTKDWTIDIVNDKNQKVGNNETLQVGNDRDKKVGANQSEQIGKNKSITVGENHTESISGSATIDVGKDQSLSVGGNNSINVDGSETVNVDGDESLSIGGDCSESVGGDMTVTVAKDLSQTISKNATTKVADNYTLKAGKDGSINITKKTTIQSGDDFTITAKKKAVINVTDELTLKCGSASIILKKNGDIQIKGKKINIQGSGDVKIKGSKVAAN